MGINCLNKSSPKLIFTFNCSRFLKFVLHDFKLDFAKLTSLSPNSKSSSKLNQNPSQSQIQTVNQVLRFEWSLGIKGENPGTGVFNKFTENIWHDVGKYNNITHCLSNGKELEHDEMYILYVKAWYSYTDYMVFTSSPVLVDLTPPKVRRGSSVIESVDGCQSDVDFLSETRDFDVCWNGIFSDRDSLSYKINGGTSPYGMCKI